jgi:hypothetical protein
MNILTLGDSFTYGEELQSPADSCWPNQLANKLSARLVNLGKPSNSNPAMVRQLVIIGWSSPGRTEHSDIGGNYNIWPGYSGNMFKEFQPWREELLRYMNQYHNDEYLGEAFLQQIILVQNLLENRSIPYLMLNTVGSEYYKNNFVKKFGFYSHLLNVDNFIGWPGDGMAEWVGDSPKGPNGHFLEDGHQIVAEKIYEYLRNSGRVS